MNLLEVSLSGAFFIIAVMIIRAVAIHKLPKKSFLVLWETILLKLLIPFPLPSAFSIYTLIHIHWFNPLVWVMYLLFNRDIELACDESVIRQFGESAKSAYSLMLIDMEAKKSGLLLLCNHFSKMPLKKGLPQS